MPNVKSAKKRVKTSAARKIRNRSYQSTLKTVVKKALSSKNAKEAETTLSQAVSFIDKCSRKELIHRNTAARLKSRLTDHAKRLPA